MEKIISKNNEKIKNALKLFSSSKLRKSENLFIIEGARLCFDAATSEKKIKTLFATEEAMEKYQNEFTVIFKAAETAYEITNEISEKMADTNSPQGIFCVCETFESEMSIDNLKNDGKYIALENIQDPANLGAISRTAEALGMSGLIVCSGCDIFNPKALRASMGSLFRLPIFKTQTIEELFSAAKSKNIMTLTTTPSKNAKKINDIVFKEGVISVIGNEGNGASKEALDGCDECVTIPMKGRAQSLNASMAACIMMWEMLK